MLDISQVPIVDDPLGNAITLAPKGWFVEFGVASGQSLVRLVKAGRPTIGLDTFNGLPENWRPEFPAGTFAEKHIPHVPGAMVLVGLFADTLPKLPPMNVALCHIDCDLYAGARDALEWLKSNAAPGCIVVFDEYYGYPGYQDHEAKALDDSGLSYTPLFRSVPEYCKLAIQLP